MRPSLSVRSNVLTTEAILSIVLTAGEEWILTKNVLSVQSNVPTTEAILSIVLTDRASCA